ncbi:hypothetical protein TL16_g01371 [Triparma laevis f. inornata]|uniref:MYND-type domain-containing protein n=2 Tax=Triparma laevis TaxID=1534972 RepID=A0A9W7DRJ1_9STRA|nr:hypothetical protein TL16_g01371 [Triparma laevis f. inornata]GMH53584.1 hypothetical protein TrLO_g209 [Triparma laevis f. longispina]
MFRSPLRTWGKADSVHASEVKKTAEEIAKDNRCEYCKKPGAEGKCLRCGSIRYCNKKCQKAHWKKHKKECGNMKKNFSPLSAGPYGNPNECFANASAFHSNGDEEQAIVYFHKALEGYTCTLGATHAHCYQTTYNLGCIYDFRGEMENAKKYFTLTSEGWANHPDNGKTSKRWIDTTLQLAKVLRRYFEEDRATELYKEVRKIQLRLNKGRENKEAVLTLYEICLCLFEKGEYDEALRKMKKVYAWQEENLGAEYAHTIETLNGLGMVHHKLERYSQAVDYFERSLKHHIEVHGFSDKLTNCTADEFMLCLIESKYDDKRLEDLMNTHTCLRKLRKPTRLYDLGKKCNKKTIAETAGDLEKSKADIEEIEKGIKFLEISISSFRNQCEPDSKEVIASESEIAGCHYAVGKLMMSQGCDLKDGKGEQWEKAREHFMKAVDALRNNRVEARQGLADGLMMTGNIGQALVEYNWALEHYERNFEEEESDGKLFKILASGFMVVWAKEDGWDKWCERCIRDKSKIYYDPIPHNPEVDGDYTKDNIRSLDDLWRQYPLQVIKASIKLGLITGHSRLEITEFIKKVADNKVIRVKNSREELDKEYGEAEDVYLPYSKVEEGEIKRKKEEKEMVKVEAVVKKVGGKKKGKKKNQKSLF